MTFDTLPYEIKAGAEIYVSGGHIVHLCPQLKPLKHNKLSYSLFQKELPCSYLACKLHLYRPACCKISIMMGLKPLTKHSTAITIRISPINRIITLLPVSPM